MRQSSLLLTSVTLPPRLRASSAGRRRTLTLSIRAENALFDSMALDLGLDRWCLGHGGQPLNHNGHELSLSFPEVL